MTNEDISVLRADIRELKNSIHRLEMDNLDIKSKLFSLGVDVKGLWFEIWAPALALAPWAFIIFHRMLEHVLAPK
jgi:hypothetical protein